MGYHLFVLNNTKEKHSYLVRNGLLGMNCYSKLLSPGEMWFGVIEEDAEYKEFLSQGIVNISISLSHQEKDLKVNVKNS